MSVSACARAGSSDCVISSARVRARLRVHGCTYASAWGACVRACESDIQAQARARTHARTCNTHRVEEELPQRCLVVTDPGARELRNDCALVGAGARGKGQHIPTRGEVRRLYNTWAQHSTWGWQGLEAHLHSQLAKPSLPALRVLVRELAHHRLQLLVRAGRAQQAAAREHELRHVLGGVRG